MTLIFLGLALWWFLHFMPALKLRFRSTLIKTLGPNFYAGGFALGLVGSIILMVMGWRSAGQSIVYALPQWTALPGTLFVLAGVTLFGFGFDKNMKTNLKRFVRHLQLTGMLLWTAGHLMLNGDNRSLVLFGGLGPLVTGYDGPCKPTRWSMDKTRKNSFGQRIRSRGHYLGFYPQLCVRPCLAFGDRPGLAIIAILAHRRSFLLIRRSRCRGCLCQTDMLRA